jgi:hypothetical protein
MDLRTGTQLFTLIVTMTEPRHPLPKEFTEGTKEQRLQALRENKEREVAEWLRRENEKVARSS